MRHHHTLSSKKTYRVQSVLKFHFGFKWKSLCQGARSLFKAPFGTPTVRPGSSGLIKVGSGLSGRQQIQDIQRLLECKNQLHYHISRQESGSSRGVPDPSASLDAIHPADRSSPHVSGSKDLNLFLPQVWILLFRRGVWRHLRHRNSNWFRLCCQPGSRLLPS